MTAPADGWELRVGERGYPDSLLDLDRPPEVVYGRGDPSVLLGPAASVVGARRASPYGLAAASLAARVCAECGVTVVSGGAMGCDRAATLAAVRAGGRSTIVSGCGADVVYPSSSQDAFDQAVSSGGAVVSFRPWGEGPRRWAFPRRNELIAALGSVLVVAEAGIRSGTMSTADCAAQLGRTLYAVPGSIFSPGSAGTNQLCGEGARIVSDERSLELSLALDFGVARACPTGDRAPLGPVMSALVASPMRPDDLAASLGESVLTMLRTLTDYESRGIVIRMPDGRYSPTREWLEHAGDVV